MKAAIIALSRTDIKDYSYYIAQVIDNAHSLRALNDFPSTQDETLADVLGACGVPICDISARDMTTVHDKTQGGQA